MFLTLKGDSVAQSNNKEQAEIYGGFSVTSDDIVYDGRGSSKKQRLWIKLPDIHTFTNQDSSPDAIFTTMTMTRHMNSMRPWGAHHDAAFPVDGISIDYKENFKPPSTEKRYVVSYPLKPT